MHVTVNTCLESNIIFFIRGVSEKTNKFIECSIYYTKSFAKLFAIASYLLVGPFGVLFPSGPYYSSRSDRDVSDLSPYVKSIKEHGY